MKYSAKMCKYSICHENILEVLNMSKKSKTLAFILMFVLVLTVFVNTSSGSNDEENFDVRNGVVAVDGLSLRSGPGTEFEVVGTLQKNQDVTIYADLDGWYIIQDPVTNKVGCVKAEYITIDGNTNEDGDGNDTETNTGVDIETETLLDMVNELRASNGLSELDYSAELAKVAYDKAKDMVERNYFSHQAVSYGSPFEMMKCYGIVFTKAAENIAGNQTIEGAFYAWTSSDSHKANILNEDYTHTGIGIYQSPVYGKVIVQMFIKQ